MINSSRQDKEEALARVEVNNVAWMYRTINVLRQKRDIFPHEFLAEVIREKLESIVDQPRSHHAWGALVSKLIKMGDIVPTGEFQPTRSRKTHAHRTAVYRMPSNSEQYALDHAVINIFRDQYKFLSNFFIEPDGTHVEREYQAAKCSDDVQRRVFNTLTPAQCKKYGRKVNLRPDWEQVKLPIMDDLVMTKFVDHENLRELLLATGDAQLIEGNNWHDLFFGQCSCPLHNGEGRNELGQILMKVRAWIR